MQDRKNWSGLKERAVITVCMHTYESASVKKLIYVSLCTGNGIKIIVNTSACRLVWENVSPGKCFNRYLTRLKSFLDHDHIKNRTGRCQKLYL